MGRSARLLTVLYERARAEIVDSRPSCTPASLTGGGGLEIMPRETRRTAFTLIELLTVMAIITLLIGILTPSLSAARNRATKTAIQAQINAMSVGLESFKSDEDEYPPSNAILMAADPTNPNQDMLDWEVGTPMQPLQGAHLLKDALVGRDSLGYDPKKTNTNIMYNRWDPKNDRRSPYIEPSGVSVTSRDEPPEDGFGIIPAPTITVPNIDNLDVNVFRDKFGWPILYYRASPTANQNTPIIQTGSNTPNDQLFGDGVYDGADNQDFTSYNMTPPNHRIADANVAITDLQGGPPPVPGPNLGIEALTNNFAEFIRSFRATTFDTTNTRQIVWPRPVNSDTFILLSAGKDGIYGTLDDIANFKVLSEER